MARIMALDYGKKRTGIAITDELKMIASGLTTVNTSDLLKFLKDYFKQEKVELLLVGLPTQKDGTPSEIEVDIQNFLRSEERRVGKECRSRCERARGRQNK